MSILRIFLISVCLLGTTLPSTQAQTTAGTLQVHYTTLNVPGAGYTNLWGVNKAGVIVGNYGSNINNDSHGFSYNSGTFTYINFPSAPQGMTIAMKINDSNIIVGIAGQAPIYGFTYDGVNFTKIQDGGAGSTATFGINNAGEIVGGEGSIYATHGFDLRVGIYKKLNVLGTYSYVYASGVSNNRTISGWTDSQSFLCSPGGVTCPIFIYPNAAYTKAWGLNDKGEIVGFYNGNGTNISDAFVYKKGKFLSFGIPGAVFTGATGINNLGQIVGAYSITGDTTYQGFITDPITDADFDKAFASAGVDSQ